MGIILTASGCTSGKTPGGDYNIILISVDTLRADRLGCYGYDRPTSPAVDNFAGKSVLFENVIAESSWTLPSHMTIFTGLYPRSHGVVDSNLKLNEEIPTLTGKLRSSGYKTYADTGGAFVHGSYGFKRGFQKYDNSRESFGRVLYRASKHIDSVKNKSDFFLFLHTFTVHCPYSVSEKLGKKFDTQPPKNHIDTEGKCGNPHYNSMNLNSGEVKFLSDRYDASIRRMDEAFGRFYEYLSKKGILENTVLVFLSDHGEEFMEHGQIGHERTLFRESLKVPLIIKVPGYKPSRIDRPAGLVDVMPTLLDLAGIQIPSRLQGRSLIPLMKGGETDLPEYRFSSLDREVEYTSVVDYPYHLIRDSTEDK